MAKLTLDLSGRAGMAPKHHGDVDSSAPQPQYRYVGKDGQVAQGVFNPMRAYGYMSPATPTVAAVTESDSSTSFTNELRCSVFESGSGSFYFGENGNLLWGAGFSNRMTWVSPLGGFAISGTNVKVTDMEVYQINGVKEVFFSYQKNGGGDIGYLQPSSNGGITTNNNTWLSGTVSGGFNIGAANDHFMRVADNGFMYIFDGYAVHKVDGTAATGGTNGTATGNVLIFPQYFTIVDAIDWRGNLYIGVQTSQPLGAASVLANNEQVVGVYVWDRQSTVLGSKDFIPMNGVREIRRIYVTPTGELRAIVISSQRMTQIRRYNGATFELLETAGVGAYPFYRDSFTFMGDLAVWLGFDAKFYAHGSLAQGDPEALYIIGDMSATTGVSSYSPGAVLYYGVEGGGTQTIDGLIWSVNANGTPHNQFWYPNGSGTIQSQSLLASSGDVYSLVKYLPKLSTVNYINVFCAPGTSTGSSAQGTVAVYFNGSTTPFKSYSVTRDDIAKGYLNIPVGKPYINAIQLKVSWTTNVTLADSYDFRPSFAIVDYTATETFR